MQIVDYKSPFHLARFAAFAFIVLVLGDQLWPMAQGYLEKTQNEFNKKVKEGTSTVCVTIKTVQALPNGTEKIIQREVYSADVGKAILNQEMKRQQSIVDGKKDYEVKAEVEPCR